MDNIIRAKEKRYKLQCCVIPTEILSLERQMLTWRCHICRYEWLSSVCYVTRCPRCKQLDKRCCVIL